MSAGIGATGIGSHPGDTQADHDEAVRLVWGELDLPYLPEVPGRGAHADLVGRTLAMLVGLAVDHQPAGWRLTGAGAPSLDQRRAISLLGQDLDTLEEHAEGYTGAVKLQLAGPWTLAAAVERPRGDRLLADHGARRDLAQSLTAGAVAHVADVRRRLPGVTEVVVQVDEPALPAVMRGSVPTASGFHRHRSVDAPLAAPALEEMFAAIRDAGADPVLHCCAAEVPFDLLEKAGAPGLSVDLALLGAGDHDRLAAAHEAGRRVHLGVLPARGPHSVRRAGTSEAVPTASSVAGLVERVLEMSGIEPSGSVVLTPACGLAGADHAWARTALGLLREAARALG